MTRFSVAPLVVSATPYAVARREAPLGVPLRGLVRSRTIAAFTLERIRLRQRGNLVVTTGYGLGAGTVLYMVDQSRSGDEFQYGNVQSATLAVSGSVDVAFRVPPGTHYVEGGPLDFYVGLRSALLFGAPAVARTVPSAGEIPRSRGLGSTMQLLFGARFGFFSEWFP